MTNVAQLKAIECHDVPSEQVLKRAIGDKIRNAVVLGYDEDNDFYFASAQSDGAETLWLLQLAIHKLMRIGNKEVELIDDEH